MDVLVLTAAPNAPFLSQGMAALEERGVSFETLVVPGEASGDRSRGLSEYLRFVPTVLAEAGGGYDLVHAHYGTTAPAALAQRRLPVVLSLWGSDLHGPVAPVSRACARRCAAVVVMSAEMRELLGTECRVIPDGVDLERFVPTSRERARAAVGWSSEAHHVLFPYAPDREVKDFPRARRIVDAVDDRLDRPVRLRAVYGVDHAEVPTYVNAADALLLTSRTEGSPNSVKEALACNLPVVATDVGDVRERVAGVSPSTVATTDDGLVEGLLSVLERGERSNGRAAAREVSLERTADELLSVYGSVAGRRPADDTRAAPDRR